MATTYLLALLGICLLMDSMSFHAGPFRVSRRGRTLYDSAVTTQQRTLKASPAATSSSSSNSGPQTNKVFLGNLPFTITDDFIKNLVETNLGKNLVTNVNIIRGSKTKRPMGILFIDFVNPASAERAVAFFDGYDLDGRILNSNLKHAEEIGEAKKQKEKEKDKLPPLRISNTIYLSNLDYSLCEEELYNMCDDLVGVGLVKEVRIPLDKNTGSPRGFAYIEFHDPSSIELAINELTNVEVYGRLLRADKMTPPPKKVKEEDEM